MNSNWKIIVCILGLIGVFGSSAIGLLASVSILAAILAVLSLRVQEQRLEIAAVPFASTPSQSALTTPQLDAENKASDLLAIQKFIEMRHRQKKRIISTALNLAPNRSAATMLEEAAIEAAGGRAFRRLFLGNESLPATFVASPKIRAFALHPRKGSGSKKNVALPFLFAQRQFAEEAIWKSRSRDKSDLEKLREDVAALFEKVEYFRDQSTVTATRVNDLMRYVVSPLIQKSAEIGEPALREFKALEHIQEELMKVLLKIFSEDTKTCAA